MEYRNECASNDPFRRIPQKCNAGILNTFSHAAGIYRYPKGIPVAKLAGFSPPYGDVSEKNIERKVKK
jgi:hypothetical protein